MASSHNKVTFMSPLKEQGQEGVDVDVDDYYYETNASTDGCDCFPLFCFKWRRSNQHNRLLHPNEADYREGWWTKQLKKVKEVSEVCAGPKWKTFIRKVGGCVKGKKYNNNFQYDPQSYALNFDNCVDTEDDDLLPIRK